MGLQIICPLSHQTIKNAVFYRGFVYERAALDEMISKGRLPPEARDEFMPDHFVQGLIDCKETTISLKEKESDKKEKELDELYASPISLRFPFGSEDKTDKTDEPQIFCSVDGYVYGRTELERAYNEKRASPMNRKPIGLKNLFLHPFFERFKEALIQAKKDGKTEMNLSDIFRQFEQTGYIQKDFGLNPSPYLPLKPILYIPENRFRREQDGLRLWLWSHVFIASFVVLQAFTYPFIAIHMNIGIFFRELINETKETKETKQPIKKLHAPDLFPEPTPPKQDAPNPAQQGGDPGAGVEQPGFLPHAGSGPRFFANGYGSLQEQHTTDDSPSPINEMRSKQEERMQTSNKSSLEGRLDRPRW